MTSILASTIGLPELGIILAIVLVVFGSTKLPKLARSLGQAQKEFKKGLNEDMDSASTEDKEEKTSDS